MSKVKLETGKKYIAGIKLSFFEALVTNEYIQSMIEEHGFKDVIVTGSATEREVHGIWTGSTEEFDAPSQVVYLDEVVDTPEEPNAEKTKDA